MLRQCSKAVRSKDFVRTSAFISVAGQYLTAICLSSICFLTQFPWIAKCFSLLRIPSSSHFRVSWVSWKRSIWLLFSATRSASNSRHQRTSLHSSDAATNFASVLEKAITDCFLVFHSTVVLRYCINTPVVDFLVVLSLPQSASAYAVKSEPVFCILRNSVFAPWR